jgi:hypothetical protein
MSLLGLFAFTLFAFFQDAAAPLTLKDLLDHQEMAKLAAATNIAQRIKVYEAASKRYQETLEAAIIKNDFSQIPEQMRQWSSLLSESLKDIEENLKTKKKSKQLIDYEIQVRKGITAFQDYKVKIPIEQQDIFGLYLTQVEKVRKRFIEIIFQRG